MLTFYLPIPEIPCYLIKTAGAAMGTAGYKEADTDTRSVGNIIVFDCSVIHFLPPSFENQRNDKGQRTPAANTIKK